MDNQSFPSTQNLLDAVHKALGREISAIDAVPIEGKSFVPDALLSGKIETIPKISYSSSSADKKVTWKDQEKRQKYVKKVFL